MAFVYLKDQGLDIIKYLRREVLLFFYFLPDITFIFSCNLSEFNLLICKLMLQWANLCKAYLLEAKWYYSGYTPTLEEYIENAWVSISAPLTLVHSYFLVTNNSITKEDLAYLEEYPNIIRCSSMVLRLADDLGTSSVHFPQP